METITLKVNESVFDKFQMIEGDNRGDIYKLYVYPNVYP